MAWCRQATRHYLSQSWPRSLSPYDVTRPQWVNGLPGWTLPPVSLHGPLLKKSRGNSRFSTLGTAITLPRHSPQTRTSSNRVRATTRCQEQRKDVMLNGANERQWNSRNYSIYPKTLHKSGCDYGRRITILPHSHAFVMPCGIRSKICVTVTVNAIQLSTL